MNQTHDLRLAIDVGGTFTDTVLMGSDGAILASVKTLTTHLDPAIGALAGADKVLASAGVGIDRVTRFIHGTTLATNALLEKRGAQVVTITTDGFRDILEIAYERRYSQYDLSLEKPDLLVTRDRAFTVPERMSVDGRVLIPLDETAVPPLVQAIDAAEAEAVAICLLHAYANPSHERRLRDLLAETRPDLRVSISSEISPEAREFDRLCTTLANAYIQPLMSGYLSRFAEAFADRGLRCPILMMTAGGGMTTLETAARLPIRLVESGPAGGAILAARIARQSGLDEVLSFDMGGTTAKLCLIDEGEPQTSRRFEIGRAARFIKGSGMPVRIPVIEMIEIGAGGGSIAAVDRLGRLTVGPESAGSEPGPVAFGKGGQDPTVTDADISLGYIRPDTFGDGALALDPAAGRDAIDTRVGAPLDMSCTDAADGISRIVDEAMASAARAHAVESGKHLGDRVMIAFGGNGPLHACRVARSTGVSRILIPPNPGVGSAVGFLYAPVSFETVRSRYATLPDLDVGATNSLFSEMEAEAISVVRLGAPKDPIEIRKSAFMRYRGQGHEIEIRLEPRSLDDGDIPGMVQAFETAYARQYSRPVPGMKIEILNWCVRVATRAVDIDHPITRSQSASPDAPEYVTLTCDVSGKPVHAAVIDRTGLQPGARVPGPALITEAQTTSFVGAGFSAELDAAGNILMTREAL